MFTDPGVLEVVLVGGGDDLLVRPRESDLRRGDRCQAKRVEVGRERFDDVSQHDRTADDQSDLVRLLLGVGVCIWLVVQLFYGPRDAHGYRTWLYLGLVAVPFTIILLVAVW